MCRLLKALPLTLAIAALIVLATFAASCGSGNTAQARFVNAISDDTQALDIEFNANKAFTAVGPFTASGSTYVGVPTGSDKIAGFATGTTTQVFSVPSPVSYNSGSQYTVVAIGQLAGTVTIVAPVDTNTEPANGSVNFRVINASLASPGSMDVYILQDQDSTAGSTCTPAGPGSNCPPTITGIASPLASTTPFSSYVNVPYNSLGFGYTLYVTITEQSSPYYAGPYSFNAGSISVGSIRTIVLTDAAGGHAMSTTPIVLSDLN